MANSISNPIGLKFSKSKTLSWIGPCLLGEQIGIPCGVYQDVANGVFENNCGEIEHPA